jgi:hypothetical protein
MVQFLNSSIRTLIPTQYLVVNEDILVELLTNYLEQLKTLDMSTLTEKQQRELPNRLNRFLKLLGPTRYSPDDDWIDNYEPILNFDSPLSANFEEVVSETFSNILKKKITVNHNKLSDITILSYNFAEVLYFTHGLVPIITRDEAPLIPLMLSKNGEVDMEQYMIYSFNTKIFSDITSVEELKLLYSGLQFDNELDLDRFLYCAEEMLGINIFMLSNKFPTCENCNKYIFTSISGNRIIREDRPVYFLYRLVNDDNSMTFHKIKFIDLTSSNIVDTPNVIAYGRLINKYNDNNEIIDVKKVEFEPSDVNRDLPVIEVIVPIDNVPTQVKLFVGSTYNLYSMNKELVGRLDIISVNNTRGLGNIEWIEKYPKKLLLTL